MRSRHFPKLFLRRWLAGHPLAPSLRVCATTDQGTGCRFGFCLQLDRRCSRWIASTKQNPHLTSLSQFTFLVVEITPVSIKTIGHKTYIYFCIFNACFVPMIYFLYPETANMELNDIYLLFNGRKVLLHLPPVSRFLISARRETVDLSEMRLTCPD